MIICVCEDVTSEQVVEIIKTSSSIDEVFCSGIGTWCGCCSGTIHAMIETYNKDLLDL
jgi:bacterioferritin-associated ferredoxin